MSESAIKLHSVTINRDLSINKTLKVSFSTHNISVIYGENGCGKTTFLRCLSAVFAQNDAVLLKEKVESIVVEYSNNHIVETVEINRTEEKEVIKDENEEPIIFTKPKYDWVQFKKHTIRSKQRFINKF